MPTKNIISVNVQEPYLSLILKGKKTVEGRLNKGKFLSIEAGDVLEIGGAKFKVTGTATYSSFLEMVTAEGVENVIPDKSTPAEAAQVYYRFFTSDQERQFGVKAIRIVRT